MSGVDGAGYCRGAVASAPICREAARTA